MTRPLRFPRIVGAVLGPGWTLVAATAQGASGLGVFGIFFVLSDRRRQFNHGMR